MARICLINPRFPTSFWGLNHGLPLLGKAANMPALALPVLAGLTPPEHEIVLIDENVQGLDLDALRSFDIVGLTGMTVQRDRMREVFVGEAEETLPRFLADWSQGRHAARYEQAEKTDMSRVPIPRYDLVPFRRYAMGCVQTSRGCPYQC